ncbi:MAG: PQQ-binding-like beta-propeller repeat protein [Acidobacteria bacterium]|nr:PQQ-binding-like beta-propeller repeat protein [Acidobacteriota bacterium]MYJ04095.1 PQQ-binding-like beta-propeller repeat protein [Acidobacteriota bacterium]
MISSNWAATRRLLVAMTAVAMVTGTSTAAGQQGRTTRQGAPPNITAGGQTNWTSHNLDLDNSRYSELDQINAGTAGRLSEQWSYEVAAGIDVAQVTPLVVDGLMYLHAGPRVIAINAVTGEEVWNLELNEARTNRVRGPTYAEGKIYSYNGPNLVAADAKTGELVESYGDGGVLPVVGLALQAKYPDVYPPTLDPHELGYRITAAPAYHDGTLYVGAALSEGHIPGGLVIATDAATGAIKWVFNTIPQRPQDDGWEIARDTWGDGQRAGGGVWTQPAIDLDLGLIYFNTGNPSPDYDGSARPGANLFTNATVALDLETGALRWYYQAIHHDLWDWDHVTGPVLFDVTRNGETIRGVGSAGKNCLLYLWHRETGEPINPMVETLVPTETNVPGEVVYPTQPIPHNARGVPMMPFCATYVHLDDPEMQSRSRQMYTPYSIEEHLIVAHGGSSFGSPAFSPRTGLLYVTGKNAAVSMIVRPVGDSLEPGPHGDGHSANFEEISRIPEFTPTTTLTAYEPASGEEVWQQVFPALTTIGASGNLATAGDLVFQGADDGAFYAFHAETGELLFEHRAPRPVRSSPMTYQVNGKQYVTVIATNTVLTFTLP